MAQMKAFARLSTLLLALTPAFLQAHSTHATMDAAGTSSAFTGLARVTCFNDGSGDAAYLSARVRDTSPPVSGLLISLQALKGAQAVNVTDTVSGDANWSDTLALAGGNGVYTIMVNKTAAGARGFDIEWHCMTADHLHTGTDIVVDQFQ